MPVQASSNQVPVVTNGCCRSIQRAPRHGAISSPSSSKQEKFNPLKQLINDLDEEQVHHPDIRKAIADLRMAQGDNVEASHHLSELASSHPCRAENWLNWAASLKGLKFTVAQHRF